MGSRNSKAEVARVNLDEFEAEIAEGQFLAAKVAKAGQSREDLIREASLNELRRLGQLTVDEESMTFEGTRFVLPATYRGNEEKAARYIMEWSEGQKAKVQFSRTFKYRPYDVAWAFQEAMNQVFGTSGVAKPIPTFFGPIPPEVKTIDIGWNRTAQIPWGKVTYAPLNADFYIDLTRTKDAGLIGSIACEAPKRFKRELEAFFGVIENILRTQSIYRGKAVNGAEMPEFLNVNAVDPNKVIYSAEVLDQLEANVWSLVRYTDNMRAAGFPLKRAILLEGPYGTGKSLAGLLTAQICVDNGWTFLQVRPGQDNLFEVLKTAQLYGPAVVWCEDIDTIANANGDETDISTMLDALDGITAKGVEVVAVFTTNHVTKIQKGAMRPGRLDAVVHIGAMDASGFEKLTKVLIPSKHLRDDIDYAQVAEAFDGFLPAFASEAIGRAFRYQMARNQGHADLIGTEDLVNAAKGLRPQLELMNGNPEQNTGPTLDRALAEIVTRTIDGIGVVDSDGDPVRHGEYLSTDHRFDNQN
jgi:transitional endoplasmic reticulum ATPase